MLKQLQVHLHRFGLWWYFFLMGIVYFGLQWNHFFDIPPVISSYDDGLQYALSKSISAGKWLGTYYSTTLSKGLTFPLWTSFLHVHKVPLWLGDEILYFISCLALVYAVSKIISKKWVLALLYGVILLSPVMLVRAYRDTIAPAILLLILSWGIGMFSMLTISKRKKSKLDIFLFTILGIIGWPAWNYLREDSFWAIPLVFGLVALGFLYYLHGIKWKVLKNARSIVLIILLLMLPIAANKLVGMHISSLNKHYYKRYVVNDFTSSDFTNAYADLTRVSSNVPKALTVPVSRDMREKLYKAIPLFKKLESCLDIPGGECENFEKYGTNANIIHDYQGGWFPWALRLAVQNAGYYKNAATSALYYTDLSKEIAGACKSKVLNCHSATSLDLTTTPTFSTIKPFLINFKDAVSYLTMLNQISNSSSDGTVFKPYDTTSTNQSFLAQYYGVRYATKRQSFVGESRYSLLKFIARIYIILNPILFCISIIALISSSVSIFRKKLPKDWRLLVLCWALLSSIMLRSGLLAYVQTVSFPTISVNYFSSTYVIMFVFEVLSVSLLQNYVLKFKIAKTSK